MRCETVKVVNPLGGWVIINKSDFDPEKHTLYGYEVKAEEPKPEAPRKYKRREE